MEFHERFLNTSSASPALARVAQRVVEQRRFQGGEQAFE